MNQIKSILSTLYETFKGTNKKDSSIRERRDEKFKVKQDEKLRKERKSRSEKALKKKREQLYNNISQMISSRKKIIEDSLEEVNTHELLCPICKDFIVRCVTTVCGHSFCERCISESLLFFKECPICRANIRKYKNPRCLMVDNMIEKIATNSNTESEIQTWKKRNEESQKWVRDKMLVNVPAGSRIDVRDTECIWCVGYVKLKIEQPNQPPLLFIHYEGWHKIFDESMPQNSERLAPLGFYSNRKDIPRYLLNPNGDNVSGVVVIGEGQLQGRVSTATVEIESEEIEDETEPMDLDPEVIISPLMGSL